MGTVIFWTIIYSISTAASIVLLGQRDLISGNLLNTKNFLHLMLNWRFMLSMCFALLARVSFIMTNNSLLNIQKLAVASTTITTFITLICLVLVVAANVIFLKEHLNLSQGIGGALIMFGILVMLN